MAVIVAGMKKDTSGLEWKAYLAAHNYLVEHMSHWAISRPPSAIPVFVGAVILWFVTYNFIMVWIYGWPW